jgi:hypothetical protein
MRPSDRQVSHNVLIQCGNPDRTIGSNDVFENPLRLLKSEILSRREECIRCSSRPMPNSHHVGCVGRLKFKTRRKFENLGLSGFQKQVKQAVPTSGIVRTKTEQANPAPFLPTSNQFLPT